MDIHLNGVTLSLLCLWVILIKNCYQKHPNFNFIIEDETRNYEIFDVMNINLNNLDVALEFTVFISDLKNRGLYKTGEVASNDDKLMILVTCDTCKNSF